MNKKKIERIRQHFLLSDSPLGPLIARLRWGPIVVSKKRIYIRAGTIWIKPGWLQVTPVETICTEIEEALHKRKSPMKKRGVHQ